jgi:glutaredoxin
MKSCPYCKQAINWMKELEQENPAYSDIEIKTIDENLEPDIAEQYDYYYVPTYYINGEKVHEGVATKEKIKQVFDTALL